MLRIFWWSLCVIKEEEGKLKEKKGKGMRRIIGYNTIIILSQ